MEAAQLSAEAFKTLAGKSIQDALDQLNAEAARVDAVLFERLGGGRNGLQRYVDGVERAYTERIVSASFRFIALCENAIALEDKHQFEVDREFGLTEQGPDGDDPVFQATDAAHLASRINAVALRYADRIQAVHTDFLAAHQEFTSRFAEARAAFQAAVGAEYHLPSDVLDDAVVVAQQEGAPEFPDDRADEAGTAVAVYASLVAASTPVTAAVQAAADAFWAAWDWFGDSGQQGGESPQS
ncbi:hypothetical protein ACFQ78_19665 [Streptomyces sp. NPDC056519]|uniref:hypothetical protein n=1 Tax=Streptomyces sp. NPDC056519 TaxID=3345849 RepID=UPI0036B8DB42